MSKKLIKTLNDREFYARYADYAGSDENGDRISDRKVKSVTVDGSSTMVVETTEGDVEVPVVPVPSEEGLVLKSSADGSYGWGHGEVPGNGKLKVKLGGADAADTGFSADVHSDVTLEIPVATSSADGLMSATDKTEFDRISTGFDGKAEKADVTASIEEINESIAGMSERVEGEISALDTAKASKTELSDEVSHIAGEITSLDSTKANKTELSDEVNRIDEEITALNTGKQDVIDDLPSIRSGASAGATAYQLPENRIPKSDLASDVQASLGKADTALQEHQDISGKAEKSEMTIADVAGDGTKKNIQLKSGLGQDVLVAHQDISGKADVATTLAGYGITDATIVKSNGSATVTLGNESLLFGTTTFQTIIDDIVIDDNSPLVSDPDVTLVSHVSGTELLARRAFEDEYGHNIHDTYATKTEFSEEVTRIDGELSALNTEKQDVIGDLPDIRSGAAAGATAYQRPENGIPKSDLASEVQTSLGKADTALQEHQDISGKAEKSEMAIADVSGDGTKKNIQLKTGLAQDVLVAHQGITAGDGINVSSVDNVLTIAHQVEVVSLTAELVSGTDTDYAVTVPLNKYTMITVPPGAGTLTVNVPAAPEGVLQEAAFQFDVGAGEDFDFDVRTNNVQLKRIAPLSLTAGNSYQGTVIGGLCTLGEFEEVH